jgi:hypothetical protein
MLPICQGVHTSTNDTQIPRSTYKYERYPYPKEYIQVWVIPRYQGVLSFILVCTPWYLGIIHTCMYSLVSGYRSYLYVLLGIWVSFILVCTPWYMGIIHTCMYSLVSGYHSYLYVLLGIWVSFILVCDTRYQGVHSSMNDTHIPRSTCKYEWYPYTKEYMQVWMIPIYQGVHTSMNDTQIPRSTYKYERYPDTKEYIQVWMIHR